MSDETFAPILEVIGDIIGWSESLIAGMNGEWAEDQQKLAEIVLTSAQSASARLVTIPVDSEMVSVWKHDALSPLIAISSAVDILVEDFEAASAPELLDYARKISAASERGRKLVVETADATRRKMLNK